MVCKAISPLTELTYGMWVEGASHHHLTKAHQDVWSFEMCVTLKNVRPKTWQDTEGEYVGWLGHCCLLSMQWLRSAESACALARALFVTPVILQGPRPVTHPFTLCPRLLWHMPFPTFLGAQSLEQAHQRSAQGPPVSDPVSTIILYHFPAREETEGQSELVTIKQIASGTRSPSSWRPSPLLPRKHQYLRLGVDTCIGSRKRRWSVGYYSRGGPVQGSPTTLHAAAILSKVILPQASRKKEPSHGSYALSLPRCPKHGNSAKTLPAWAVIVAL